MKNIKRKTSITLQIATMIFAVLMLLSSTALAQSTIEVSSASDFGDLKQHPDNDYNLRHLQSVTYILSADISLIKEDHHLLIPSDVVAVVDLNGHTITGYKDKMVFEVYGNLTITDIGKGGKITGDLGVLLANNSTFTMSGGEISGCDYSGVYLSGNNSTFTMLGGEISECGDLGVYLYGNNSTFTMSGGEISGCGGNGVSVDGNNTLFSMSGGTIFGNKKSGVWLVSPSSSFLMSGGSIVGNNSYGVNLSGTFSISGSAVIKDNVEDGTKEGNVYIGGTPSNVYNSSTTTFSISGPLDADADIRVDDKKLNDFIYITIPEGEGSYQYTASDVAKIHNADGSLIGAIVDGKVMLKKPFGDNITVTATQSATYTGNAIAPTISVSDGNTPLAENTDYTIAYLQGASATTEMINQGEYTIKITAKGDYSGEKNVTFTINSKPITADGISVDAISSQNYTGTGITPALTITDGSTPLVLGTDYTVTCTDNINIGTATATITGIGNYTGTIEKTFTILPVPVTVAAEDKTKTFGESDPEFTATVTGLVNNDSPDLITYILTRTEGENVGEYTITAKGDEKQGNYEVRFVDATLTITKATPKYTIPTIAVQPCNTKLADITLPEGFAFAPNSEELTIGENILTLTYNPDENNYETVIGIKVTITVKNHEYGTPTYTWSNDLKTCDAKVVCKNDANHFVTEKATITSKVTTPATTEAKGVTTYTATFKNTLFATQTKAVEDIEKLEPEPEPEPEPQPNPEPQPEPDPQNPSTPVSSIDNGGNNVKGRSYAHTIYIASTPDSQYKIIDLQGRTIKSATTKSSYEEVNINNSGIYVVIINGKSYKVSL